MAEEDRFKATGSGVYGFLTNYDGDPLPFAFGGIMYGHTVGVFGFCGREGLNQQNGYTQYSGVQGVADNHTGTSGVSLTATGVFGQTEAPEVVPGGFLAGVVGAADTQPGVIGYSKSGDAVQGASFTGTAVHGYSFFGTAVSGLSGGNGPQVPNTPTAGVFGTSNSLPGVIGTSDANAGVIGFSNSIGVLGRTTNPASFAGFFAGNVNVTGTLTAATKNAVVAFPDGTRRLLHCMESPEHWFEDFGSAKLKRGCAVVKLDADFAKVIKASGYHVFLTPRGDCGGLYVRRQDGASFEVRELGGGKSDVAFSYRIVGLRKDIRAHRRFARFDGREPRPPKASPRKPPAAALRSFVAGLEKKARARRRKRAARPRGSAAQPVRFEASLEREGRDRG